MVCALKLSKLALACTLSQLTIALASPLVLLELALVRPFKFAILVPAQPLGRHHEPNFEVVFGTPRAFFL